MNFYTLIFNKKVSSKKAVILLFTLFAFLMSIVATINYVVDPMWIFQHKNYFNVKQLDFDERQQKTNYLYFRNQDYDSVILGSSRTTYLNSNQFRNNFGKTYNYAVNAMSPYEYEIFLDNFDKIVGKQPKSIILGLDFFGSNKNRLVNSYKKDYLSNSKDYLYKLKMLYNLDILQYSISNIRETFRNKKAHYNSNLVKEIDVRKDKKSTLKDFIPYEYDTKLLEYYKQLLEKYKGTNFIIFTPPVTIEQLIRNHKNGLDNYYFQWLRDLVKIFKKVNHFMYPTAFSKNYSNFYDANHFHHISGKIIANKIIKGYNKKKVKNGIVLDNKNIEKFIRDYKKMINGVGANN